MYPIELRNVTKSFKNASGNGELLILDSIDLCPQVGKSTAIIGKSGTGKSTLLQIAGGLDAPTSGSVFCNGTDLGTLSDSKKSLIRNRNMGFVFQNNMLLEDFTALENVMIPAMIAGKGKKECIDRALELLEKLGLTDRLNHLPGQLSGGERQRVAICRALMNNPEIVFADEPTGSLDEENAREVENMLFDIVSSEKKTLLLVTHNIDFANRCDMVYRLRNRKLTLEKS